MLRKPLYLPGVPYALSFLLYISSSNLPGIVANLSRENAIEFFCNSKRGTVIKRAFEISGKFVWIDLSSD